MFKEVKDLIARQTRPNAGQVDIGLIRGFGEQEKNPIKIPGNLSPFEDMSISWDKYSYIYRRAIWGQKGPKNNLTYVLVNKDFIPVIDLQEYNRLMPAIANPAKAYDFWSYSGAITQSKTNQSKTGSIKETDIPQDSNIAYGVWIPGHYQRGPSNFDLFISGDDISCSVWTVPVGQTQSIVHNMLFTTGTDRLQAGKSVKVTVNTGAVGIELWVLFYKHYFPENNNPSFNGSWFEVQADFSSILSGVKNISSINDTQPSKVASISSTSDPLTGNTVNTLNISRPGVSYYRGLSIYRYENKDLSISALTALDAQEDTSLLILNTSNAQLFKPGATVYINGQSELIKDVYNYKSNQITNSDFAKFTGSQVTSWSQVSSVPATVHYTRGGTSYPYAGDNAIGPYSLSAFTFKTNTSKSYYVEPSSYLRTRGMSQPYLSFYWRWSSGKPSGTFLPRFFSSTNGTLCSYKSNGYGLQTLTSTAKSRDWNYFSLRFDNTFNSSLPNYIPPDCVAIKPRFYPAINSTSLSGYLFANVNFSDYHYKDIFHTSSGNKIAISLDSILEAPRNTLTSFNTYFRNSTSRAIIPAVNANAVYGKPQYNTQFRTKFDNSIGITEAVTNYLPNGDLSGGFHLWTTANVSWMKTTAYSLYHSSHSIVYSNGTKKSYWKKTLNGGNFAGSGSFPLSIWAKSISPVRLKLKLDNSSATNLSPQISSATFTLTTSWSQYTLFKKFSSGGDYVTSSFMVDSGRPWSIAVCGSQLEVNKGYTADFVWQSTAGFTYAKPAQGLSYSASGIFDWNYGTVRTWYVPYMNYNTAYAVNRFIWAYYKASTDRADFYYNPSFGRFLCDVRGNHGILYSFQSTALTFATNEPLHLVFKWAKIYNQATAEGVIVVNNKPGIKKLFYPPDNSATNFYIGSDISQANQALGAISNFRIDKRAWSDKITQQDFYALATTYSNNASVVIEERKHISNVARSNEETQDYIKFVDDSGLYPNTNYKYRYAIYDNVGNESQLSTALEVYTPRQKFEYFNVNKVNNSGFEVPNTTKFTPAMYWDADSVSNRAYFNTTSDCFTGSKSLRISNTVGNPKLVYNYVSKTATSNTMYISYYTATSDGGATYFDSLLVTFYNTAFAQLGKRTYTVFSTTHGFSNSGKYWLRCSTSIAKTNITYATAMAAKYWGLTFNKTVTGQSLIDAVQAEEGSLTAYKENYTVDNSNIPTGGVDGNSLSFGVLVGGHLKAKELIVDGSTSGGNRIVIGKETRSSAFSELKATGFRYHSPNTPTAAGWNYTKHIESGSGRFGDTINFQDRFVNWNNNVINPQVMFYPKDLLTFSTAGMPTTYKLSSTFPQRLSFSVNATASSFVINAALIQMTGKFGQQTIANMYLGDGTNSTTLNATSNILSTKGIGHTVLPGGNNRSRNSAGTIRYAVSGYNIGAGKPFDLFEDNQIKVTFYATSTTHRNKNAGGWYNLGSQYRTMTYSNASYDFDFSNTRFGSFNSSAKSIAVEITSISPAHSMGVVLDPAYLYYSSTRATILKTDSAIGTFNYLAIDGGYFG